MQIRNALAGAALFALLAAAPGALHYPATPVQPVTDHY